MPFDLEAARQSGKTDEQIATYLGQSLGFDVNSAVKAGKSYSDIAQYLSTHDRPKAKSQEIEILPPSDVVYGGPGYKTRQEAGESIRPYTKGGGMLLGGVLGGTAGGVAGAAASVPTGGTTSPLTVPAGAFIGRTIGSGFGEDVGDWLADLVAGKPHPWSESEKNIKSGMWASLGGDAFGAALSGIAKGGTKAYRTIKNAFTTEGAELGAGEKLTNLSGTPTAQETTNASKVKDLEKRLTIDPLTPAQRTGSTKAGMVEQGLSSGDKEFADTMVQRESAMKDKAQTRFLDTLGKPRGLPATSPPSATGEAIYSGIQKDLAPVKKAEKVVWEEVPKLQIPSQNLDSEITKISSTPFEKPTQSSIQSTIDYISEVPRTTDGMRSIEKTLTGNITKALRSGDNNLARVYIDMKKAVKADYEAMGAAAESGDVALYQGRVVYPSKVQKQLDGIEKRLAEETGKNPVPDRQAIESALKQKGHPYLPMAGESDASHLARITKDYQKFVGTEVPHTSSVDQQLIEQLNTNKSALQNILSNVEPAEDVAAAISRAKRFSKEQKFDRFYRGQTKKVLEVGDEFEGQRIPFEQMPKKFFTPSGYKDLVRASGGNTKAAARMQPFVMDDLISSSMQGNEFSVPKALTYLRKNQEVLRMSKLDGEVKAIIKGQMPNEFERMLATKRLDKTTGEPYFTLQESRNILQKYGKTLKELYGSKSVGALRDYQELMFALSRNKNISFSGGSTTAEKILNTPENLPPFAKQVMNAVAKEWVTGLGTILGIGEAVSAGGGPGMVATGAVAGAYAGRTAKVVYDKVVERANQETMKIFKKALTDPDLAEKLMKMVRTKKPESVTEQAVNLVKPYLAPIAVAETTKEKPPAPAPEQQKRKTYGKAEDNE